MKVSFHGVRGFLPVPGDDTVIYGGNTLCMSITADSGALIAIDAGTGISAWSRTLLGGDLGRGRGSVDIIITHSHYDHTQGFLFFIPALIPGNTVRIYGPVCSGKDIRQMLEDQVHPLVSPMQTLTNFASTMAFHTIETREELKLHDISFRFLPLKHETENSLAVVFSDGKTRAGCISDVFHNPHSITSASEFFSGCDLLVHDATDTSVDYISSKRDFSRDGFTAVEVAGRAGVTKLVLTHFHHSLTDADLEVMLRRCRSFALDRGFKNLEIDLARENHSICF